MRQSWETKASVSAGNDTDGDYDDNDDDDAVNDDGDDDAVNDDGDDDLFVCLFGFLTSSSTTRLYRGRAPRQERLPHMRQSWETMTSVSAGHIIQTPTQPVGSGRPQRESNPGSPHQESRALPQSYRAPRDDDYDDNVEDDGDTV